MSVAFQVGRAKAEKWPNFVVFPLFKSLHDWGRASGHWKFIKGVDNRNDQNLGRIKAERRARAFPIRPIRLEDWRWPRRPRAASQPPVFFFPPHNILAHILLYLRHYDDQGSCSLDIRPSTSCPSTRHEGNRLMSPTLLFRPIVIIPFSIASLSLSSIIILLLLFAEFYINSCFLLRHFTVFYLFFLSCKEKRKEKSKKLFSFYFILVFGSAHIFQ